VTHFAVAKKLGCTDDEIQEAVQLAYSVGAGVMWAMAERAKQASEDRFRWWDKRSVQHALGGEAPES
jgi:alkylhydroperoxidase/carboxymuconolactone decarboxylase family protein YurZ